MVTGVEVTTGTGPIPAALAVPAGTGPWPGVVVVHDAFGLTADIRRNTARFADNGYLALAPDLFSRGRYVKCVRTVLRQLAQRSGQAVEDLRGRARACSPIARTAPGGSGSPASAWAVASHS